MQLPAQTSAGARLYDRVYDLSLRMLMAAITVVLIGCIGLLSWRWMNPPQHDGALVPVSQIAPKSAPATPVQTTAVAPEQVLLAPGQVFRCTIDGRITFTDRPCPTVTR